MTSSIQRMKEFKEFLIKRNPSKKFADKYATYLTSNVIKNNAMSLYGTESILDIDDVVKLNKVYLAVKSDAANIRLHNVYSGALSAYIKFLKCENLRKREISVPETDND